MNPRSIPYGMLTQRLLPFLLCFNIALLVFYLAIDYQLLFNSDSAVKNLLAQEVYDSGHIFPQEWNYINRDLWLFNTHIFIVPLLPFIPNGFPAHVISDMVSAMLMLYGSWLLTGLLEMSRLARLLGMVVVSAGMSLIMAEHIYGQAAYGLIYFMACYLLVAYTSLTRAQGGRWLLWAAATALLTTLIFWANPQRALLSYGLPLLSAGIVQHILERRAAHAAARPPEARHARAMGMVVLGLVAGVLLSTYTLKQVNNNVGLTLVGWLDFNGMMQNLLAIIQGVMGLFDSLPGKGSKVDSLPGAYAALRLAGGVLLILMLPWALYRALRLQRGPRQLVVVFACVSFAVHLFMMLTTSLADMSAPSGSVRYLVPSLLYMLLIFVGLTVDHDILPPLPRAAAIGALVLLATSAPTSYLYPYLSYGRDMPRQGLLIETPDLQLINFMKQQGLHYGYATFWNSNKLTVLSDGATRIRPIVIDRGIPQPQRNLTSNRWYVPSAWQGETFLMLPDSEMSHLNRAVLDSHAGQPRLLRYRDINFLVYPRNLAASLSEWDISVEQPRHYKMNEQSPRQIGAVTDGALVAQPGEQGTLHFGPMRILAPGAYAVSFDLDAEGGAEGDFGRVDVSTGAGSKIHAEQNITTAGKQRITLRFESAQTLTQVEFRAFSSGRGRLALSGIDIERIPTALEKP